MAKVPTRAPADKLALYERLVATRRDVERKGATIPYTSCNGHMFSFLTRSGTLALRLPAEAREAFLARYDAKLCVQYGTVMKEYVEVPDALLQNTRVLQTYFAQSYVYVRSLKPKPTRRHKTAGQQAAGQQAAGQQKPARGGGAKKTASRR